MAIRTLQFLLLICFSVHTYSQTTEKELVGDWKFYLEDKVTFDFLRLNPDGTGIKCFGRTVNGTDQLYINQVTTLDITRWGVKKNTLILESKNQVSFKINPEYSFHISKPGWLELAGENLILDIFPSFLNRKMFQRTVIYQKSDSISANYGTTTATCITDDLNLFSFTDSKDSLHIVEYKGFDDIIPFIAGCNQPFQYEQHYPDPAWQLTIPSSIKNWSYGFGDREFYISFNAEKEDTRETSIVVYYDFGDKSKNFYFAQLANGKEKKDIIKVNGLDIYKTINWQGKFEGKIFLKNHLIVAYYSRAKDLQQTLQQCISSFHYR